PDDDMQDEFLSTETAASERLRRLSADVLEQQDEERRWIATQLHEVSAQNVSTIALYLASLQQRSWPSGVKFILDECQTLCAESLDQILTLSNRMHPPLLDELGLTACLRLYIDDFIAQSRIQ